MSNMVVGDTILDKVWREMDVATEAAMSAHKQYVDSGGDAMVVGKLLGQARGLAIAIHIMSVPHFSSPDAVAQCAVARWQNGTADGKAPSPVKMAPPDGKISAGTAEDPIHVPAPGEAGAPLTPEQEAGIIAALSGGQPAEAIAAIFGVSVEQVTGIVW